MKFNLYRKQDPNDGTGNDLGGVAAPNSGGNDITQPDGGSVTEQTFDLNKFINQAPQTEEDTKPAVDPGIAAITAQMQQQATQFAEQQSQTNQMLQTLATTIAGGSNQTGSKELEAVLSKLADNQTALSSALAPPPDDLSFLPEDQREQFAKSLPVMQQTAQHYTTQAQAAMANMMETKLNEITKKSDERIDAMQEEVNRAKVNAFTIQVKQNHPDLYDVLASPNWKQFSGQVDPMSGYTKGELFKNATLRADPEAANHILKAYRTEYSQDANAAGPNQFGIPGSQGAPNSGQAATQVKFVRGQEQEMLARWQAKDPKVTDEVFNSFMSAFEKAEMEGNVVDPRH